METLKLFSQPTTLTTRPIERSGEKEKKELGEENYSNELRGKVQKRKERHGNFYVVLNGEKLARVASNELFQFDLW